MCELFNRLTHLGVRESLSGWGCDCLFTTSVPNSNCTALFVYLYIFLIDYLLFLG